MTFATRLSIYSATGKTHPTVSSGQIFLKFEILNLFFSKEELMDCRFLVPESFSSDTIDYRLLFVTFYLIQSLDLAVPMTSLQIIVTSFAAQLERNGLWHYATAIQMLNPHAE